MFDIYSILILLYTLFYITLARQRLDWALYILIIALPSYLIRFSIFGVPLTLLELMILIVFIVWLTQNWQAQVNKIKLILNKQKKLKKISYPYDKEIIFILIIAFISVIVAGFSNNAFGILKAYFIEPILLYIVIFNVFGNLKSEIRNWKLLFSLAISAFLVSGFAIFQKITGVGLPVDWVGSGRVTSFFEYPNAVGLYLAPIILILVGFVSGRILNTRYYIPNIFISLTIILSLLSIYFAGSEGALVGVVAGLVLFGLFINRRFRLITIGLIIVLTIGIFSNQAAREFAIEKITLKDLSGEIRKQQWRETWEMLTDNSARFIFGTGLANYQNKIAPYHQEGIFFNRDRDPDFRRKIVLFDENYKKKYWQPVEIYLYPHNIFLNFWTELGLAGMILFTWLIGRFFIHGIEIVQSPKIKVKSDKIITLGLMSAMVAIVVHGLVDVPYFKNDLVCLFLLIIAMFGMIKMQNLEIKK